MYVHIDWQHSTDELRARYQAETDGKLRQRYHALCLPPEQRMTIDEIAALVAVHPGTLNAVVHRLDRQFGAPDAE